VDAFEDLIARILVREDFWVVQNYKVNLEKEEKVRIGLHSMPPPDIDIVAYKPVTNEVNWVECKSFIDSDGMKYSSFVPGAKDAKRYRVFTDANYRDIVSRRLISQLEEDGRVLKDPRISYWLVAGKL
jgi:hypothetical protein